MLQPATPAAQSKMALTRGDGQKEGAIGDDFPIICNTCLGENPYLRMLKGTMGKECRISGRPFNSFRWQGAHNKWKETVVAPEVAREKNCCQSCLNDLEYGVPFHVRDHLLDALGTEGVEDVVSFVVLAGGHVHVAGPGTVAHPVAALLLE